MNKKHISLWLKESILEQCVVNQQLSDCKTRSEYIEKAIEFYNAYLHSKNNEEYIGKVFLSSMDGRLSMTEDRLARLLFKQAVEIAKLFRFMVMGFNLSPEEIDKIHYDCIQEVKKINGAIRYPYSE